MILECITFLNSYKMWLFIIITQNVIMVKDKAKMTECFFKNYCFFKKNQIPVFKQKNIWLIL